MEDKHYDIFPTLPQQQLLLLENMTEEAILKEDSIFFTTTIPDNTNTFHYTEKEQTEQMEFHKNFTYKQARRNNKRIEPKKWSKIIQRFKIQKKYSKKMLKNADIRLGWRSKNLFLVKSLFTFGFRKVPTGQIDLIQTTEAPILIYTPKKCVHNTLIQQVKEKTLPHTMEKSFNCYILKPFDKYLAHSNQAYIIITVQKTFFSLTRMDAHTYNRQSLKKVKSIEKYPFLEKKTQQQPPPPPIVISTKWDTTSPPVEQQQQQYSNIFVSPEQPMPTEWDTTSRPVEQQQQQHSNIFVSPEQPFIMPQQHSNIFVSPVPVPFNMPVDVSPDQQQQSASKMRVLGTEFETVVQNESSITINPEEIDLFFKAFFEQNNKINFEENMFS